MIKREMHGSLRCHFIGDDIKPRLLQVGSDKLLQGVVRHEAIAETARLCERSTTLCIKWIMEGRLHRIIIYNYNNKLNTRPRDGKN